MPHTLHVSPQGRDDQPGTTEAPLRTLIAARDRLRSLGNRDGGHTVILHGGDYPVSESIPFGEGDGGAPGRPNVWRAADGERVRLTAGRDIRRHLVPISEEAVWRRLDPRVRDSVREVDLKALGVAHAGLFPDFFEGGGGLFELFHGETRLPLVRYPVDGYLTMGKVRSGSCRDGNHDAVDPVFEYKDIRHGAWNVEEGLWLSGFWRVPWTIQTVRVRGIDPAEHTVTLASRVPGGIGSKYAEREGSGQEPYCAVNVLEELSHPGQWCLRFGARKLYLIPPTGGADEPLILSDMKAPFVRMEGARDLVFRGLEFSWGLGDGIEVEGGARIHLEGLRLSNLGGYAIRLRGGEDHRVHGCDLFGLGEGGVWVRAGDRATLTPCRHVISNNDIHHYGALRKTYAPGVNLAFDEAEASLWPVGVRILRNRIHHAPHAGILFTGNDHLIEGNEFFELARDSHDVGAIYACMDWAGFGTVIRRNLIHHSPNANGIYLDDGYSGVTVEGNVLHHLSAGIFVSGGHENTIRGNLILACPQAALHVDDRGVARGYTREHPALSRRLSSVPWNGSPWKDRYPGLGRLLENTPWPTGNDFSGNGVVACGQALRQLGEAAHFSRMHLGVCEVLEKDPGFLNGSGDQAGFATENPPWDRIPSVPPISMTDVGLHVDGIRTVIEEASLTGMARALAFDSTVDMKASNG